MDKLHKIGAVSQIPRGEGRNVEVCGRRIAVFRSRDGRVFATQAECPHRRGPLADGIVGAGQVVCPLHEWRFDLETGSTENGACPIEVFRVTVDSDGTMMVEIPSVV
jgi:nitrite reductase (NADH) small subunit